MPDVSTGQPVAWTIDYPARADRRTHIETANPNPEGYSAAWLPQAARWHPPGMWTERRLEERMAEGERKPYRVAGLAYLNDTIVHSGTVVWLTETEAMGVAYEEVDLDEAIAGLRERAAENPAAVEALPEKVEERLSEAAQTHAAELIQETEAMLEQTDAVLDEDKTEERRVPRRK